MRIALLEDDKELARLFILWLEATGHSCMNFSSGQSFIKTVSRDSFDLLLLDWLLPDLNGDEILKWVRKHIDWHIPVIFVTVRDEEKDIVYALENGADDYLVKPVKSLELLARINAVARRSKQNSSEKAVIEVGEFRINTADRNFSRNSEPIKLTNKEFELAVFLFSNSGRLLSRNHILDSVWGRGPGLNTRTVDTHVSRLRTKLGLSGEHGPTLKAVYHYGYRLEMSPEEQNSMDV
ncbi:MAG: response regulator transcription factor, partial [Gammaproteobacteria bacterium]|nr:response regulator transcription factor [Gammaproteobacteria bacterium]